MSGAQFILSTIILFIVYKTLVSYRRKRLSTSFTAVWMILWIVLLFFIFEQSLSIRIAHSIGIARGVDLIIYLSIIFIYYLVYKLFVKINDIDKKITEIVRREALKNSKVNKKIKK